MKNTQQGFIGIVLIIILAIALTAGGTYYVTIKQNSNTQVDMSTSTTFVQNSQSDNIKTEEKNPVAINNTLTDQEILSATYKISGNFVGVMTPPANIVFPPIKGTSNSKLSGNVYMDKSGAIFESPRGEVFEGFWINGYKYTDSSRTEAKVYITGSFGATGFDDRAFVVSKTNGVVTTKEVSCKKALNGSCSVDYD